MKESVELALKRIEELEETNLAELSGLVKTDQTIDDALASVLYGTDGRTTRTQSYTPTSILGRLSTIERLLDRGINVQVVGNEGFESIHKGVRGPQTSRRNDATPSNRPNDGGDNSEISAEENADGDVGIIEEITVEEEKQPNEEVAVVSEYEILESDDGFFRVRKVGSERILRKLETKEEAQEFIKQKETK